MPDTLDKLDVIRKSIVSKEILLRQTAFTHFMDMIIFYALSSAVRISKSTQRNINHVISIMDSVLYFVLNIKEAV